MAMKSWRVTQPARPGASRSVQLLGLIPTARVADAHHTPLAVYREALTTRLLAIHDATKTPRLERPRGTAR